MTFRIETVARGKLTIFVLSGRIENQAIAELRRLFELQTGHCDIVLDLKEVGVIDRGALHFFAGCEADGVKLENCAPYIRDWMERERD
jgi:predicted metal-binding protein